MENKRSSYRWSKELHELLYNETPQICPDYASDMSASSLVLETLFSKHSLCELILSMEDDESIEWKCELTFLFDGCTKVYARWESTPTLAITKTAIEFLKDRRNHGQEDSQDNKEISH